VHWPPKYRRGEVTPMHHEVVTVECAARRPLESRGREAGVRWVVVLTAATMIVEITVGYATGSMALLADGWHMATHVGALALASVAYVLARRYAAHRAFAFGTGKVHALAGYSSAILLGVVAVSMLFESVARLFRPLQVDYTGALPVAVIGLAVNVLSVFLLQAHHDHPSPATDTAHTGHGHAHGGHGHGGHAHASGHDERHRLAHHEDHNHRAVLLHVLTDAFTSVLAIAALFAGKLWSVPWLDAATGIVGGIVILHWGFGLTRSAGAELLDVVPSEHLETAIRHALEEMDDVQVRDLHLWSLGGGQRSCLVTLITSAPREPQEYHQALAAFRLAHLTIEVQRCDHQPRSRLLSVSPS